MYTLKLTDKEYELLVEVLEDYRDDGPQFAGWQTPELSALSAKVSQEAEHSQE